MRRRWKIVPVFTVGPTLALAGTTSTDGPVLHAPSPRTIAPPAPNQVIVWNRILLGIHRNRGHELTTLDQARSLAMMHLAIADAVGVISWRFATYADAFPASRYASETAAAARAAHDVLTARYPSRAGSLDAELMRSLVAVGDDIARTAGVEAGARAARTILGLRARDGAAAAAHPFVLRAADQFRPGPPPPVPSTASARTLGHSTRARRTPEQAEIAQFWSGPIQTYWNEITQAASLDWGNSTSADARLFAVLNASLADAVIACADANDAYRSCRPGTAPGEQAYPGTDSAVSFDAAEVLSNQFGRRMSLDVTSPVLPGAPRHFTSFAAAAGEAGLSRIYAGEHLRFDHVAGARLGRRVGRYVLGHALTLRPDGRY